MLKKEHFYVCKIPIIRDVFYDFIFSPLLFRLSKNKKEHLRKLLIDQALGELQFEL